MVKGLRADFRIDICLIYTGQINKDFLHFNSVLFRVQFRQV